MHVSIPPSENSASIPSATSQRRTDQVAAWVDPASLPNYGNLSVTEGNAPDYVKQLNYNTYRSYGVGDEDCFGHKVGKSVNFVDVSIDRASERQGRLEATTVAEIVVDKCMCAYLT